MTTRKDATFKRGETIRLRFVLHGPTNAILPIAVDDELQFRFVKGSTIYLLLEREDMTITDAAAGEVDVTLDDSVMDVVQVPSKGSFNYEFWYRSPILGDSCQAEGTITLEKSLKETFPVP